MRIDPDEMDFLKQSLSGQAIPENLSHVEGVHILPWESEKFSIIPGSGRVCSFKIQLGSELYPGKSGTINPLLHSIKRGRDENNGS